MKNTLTIKNNSDFVHILKKGNWYSGDFMTIYVLKNRDIQWHTQCATTKENPIVDFKNMNRLGIAVSKKFSKSSVRRNRVKRLVKEAYRLHEEKLVTGYSIVILWKNNVAYEEVNFEKVSKDFEKCFQKANLFLTGEEELNA